jgi:hypothetical protein
LRVVSGQQARQMKNARMTEPRLLSNGRAAPPKLMLSPVDEAFAACHEPEPGVPGEPRSVNSVLLTLLKPDQQERSPPAAANSADEPPCP